MNKEYYSNFKQFLTDLTTKENNIRKDLEAFQTAIGNNENTIEIENRINKELKSLKDLTEQLIHLKMPHQICLKIHWMQDKKI